MADTVIKAGIISHKSFKWSGKEQTGRGKRLPFHRSRNSVDTAKAMERITLRVGLKPARDIQKSSIPMHPKPTLKLRARISGTDFLLLPLTIETTQYPRTKIILT